MTIIAAPGSYLHQAALEYATRYGVAVLPLHAPSDVGCTCGKGRACTRPGKHPRVRGWVRTASHDLATIGGWWDQWPDANLGILTGARNGIVALDIDPRRGGDETLAELQRRHGPLPRTATVLTGGGGQHFLWGHPGGFVASTSDELGPGLDVRADGGLIVAPPSLHQSGREYAWHPEYGLDTVGIADMPAWLADQLSGARRRPRTMPPKGGLRTGFRWDSVLDGVPEGRRHTNIFLMACSLRGQDTPEAVAEALALHAAGRCRPPFPPDEALGIVHDIYRRYPANGGRAARISGERLDILALLFTAARPLQPAAVAARLDRRRDAIKKLMAAMCADGQLDRITDGYVPRPPVDSPAARGMYPSATTDGAQGRL